MDAKIDYLSFTLPKNLSGVGHSDDVYDVIADTLVAYGCASLFSLFRDDNPQPNKGRKIYGAGLFFPASNISVWWGGVANHLLIEIPGVGCQRLRDEGTLTTLLGAVQSRTTRIDLAVDLPEAGKPQEFVSKKKENRFKVTEQHDTDTGWTQYVGSRKSERYARVYLYREPHPRAGILRVEHVLRGDYAKTLAKAILDTSLSEQTTILGNTFGWEHPRWEPDVLTEGKLRGQRHDKEDAATLRWLIKAVAPALIKAHKNGLIDLDTFLKRYVWGELE